MPLPDITLPIVGTRHPNKRGPTRLFELNICRPGEPIELRPEPRNPFDEHAVAVFSCRGVRLGYIPAMRAVRIAALIRSGADIVAVFQGQTEFGGLIRIAFDGSTPDLPPYFPEEPEPDWWPDEIPPD